VAHRLFGRPRDAGDSVRTSRRLDRRRTEVSRRIRHELDTERIVGATVETVHEAVQPRRTSIWLTGPKLEHSPALAHSAGAAPASGDEAAFTTPVRECVRRQRSVWNPLVRTLAVPLLAPRSGLIGVLQESRA
jgi:GAF domain-containing protein